MIYKVFAYPDNPTYDYQYKNGSWFKRKKNSNDDYAVVNKDGQVILNKYFTKKGFLFGYSGTIIAIGAVLLIGGGYYAYTKIKVA